MYLLHKIFIAQELLFLNQANPYAIQPGGRDEVVPGTYTRFNRRHKVFGPLFQRTLQSPGGKAVRRGWCLGEDAFRRELLGQMRERMERAETGQEKAEGIIAAELKRRGWTEADLRQRPKGEAVKVKLAQRLRAETVQSAGWIANRLHLGSRAYAHLRWIIGFSNAAISPTSRFG
jgi:hypothetical protein